MSDREHYEAMQRMAKLSREMREREEKFMGWFLVAATAVFFVVLIAGSILDAIYA